MAGQCNLATNRIEYRQANCDQVSDDPARSTILSFPARI